MDVTHVNGCHYLTLIDCGPIRFAVWRRLPRQDTDSVIKQLELVFFERGAPVELLTATTLLSAVARLRSLRSDGHCVCALDAHTLLPEMALRRDVTDR